METNISDAIQYIIFAGLTAVIILGEHMAFRTPAWKSRELARRAIGDTTVLGLFALIVLMTGAADFVTWLMIVGGFAVAGATKWICQWVDDTRRASVMRRMQHDGESAD